MSSKNFKISAIVPTYNRAEYLGICLDSLLSQTRPLDELIVVSDGSTDDTDKIVESYGDKIKFLKKENGGKSSALTLGMEKASGDLIWICDDDDIACDDALETLIAPFENDPAIDMSLGLTQSFSEENGQKKFLKPVPLVRDGEPSIKINFLEEMRTNQFATLVSRELYDKVGPYRQDLIRSQDFDMILRLLRNANVARIDKVIYYYRRHAGVRGTAKNSLTALQMQEKWAYHNKLIFNTIRDSYEFEEFTPSFAKDWEESLKTRATYIQYANIFLRRGFWEDVVDALGKAVAADQRPLTKEELHLSTCVRTPECYLSELYDSPEIIKAFKAIFDENKNGKTLVYNFLHPLGFLIIKQILFTKDIKAATKTYAAMRSIMGDTTAIKRIIGSSFKKAFYDGGVAKVKAILQNKV